MKAINTSLTENPSNILNMFLIQLKTFSCFLMDNASEICTDIFLLFMKHSQILYEILSMIGLLIILLR